MHSRGRERKPLLRDLLQRYGALGLDRGQTSHETGGKRARNEQHQDAPQEFRICLGPDHCLISSTRLAKRQLIMERS
jgi:hypothetical protein